MMNAELSVELNDSLGNTIQSENSTSSEGGDFPHVTRSVSEILPSNTPLETVASNSDSKSNCDEELKLSGRSSRRKRRKQFNENYIDSGEVFQALRLQSKIESFSFDLESNILAKIDIASYRNALLQDADRILHTFLLPMSFLWNNQHAESELTKNCPKDIDEMPEILGMKDYIDSPFENGSFGYGKFEIGKSPKSLPLQNHSHCIKAAARRSNDPGVIELTIMKDGNQHGGSLGSLCGIEGQSDREINSIHSAQSPPWRSCEKKKEDEVQPTSLHLLEYYQNIQALKKRKLEIAGTFVEKKYISVRFGSISSRSSIIYNRITSNNAIENKRCTLCVQANFPLEVQTGRYLVASSALQSAKILGSYDMRFGMSKEMVSSQKTKRLLTGRTRLLWTKAHITGGNTSSSGSTRFKLAYSSSLSGSRIDIASFRRPRKITLIVRLNGIILRHNKIDISNVLVAEDSSHDEENVALASGLNQKEISQAITSISKTTDTRRSKKDIFKPQKAPCPSEIPREAVCFLRSEELLNRLLKKKKADAAASRRAAKKEISSSKTAEIANFNLIKFSLPSLDCLPSVDGYLRVACTVPGTLKSCGVSSILALESEGTKREQCSVCFTSDSTQPIESCSKCGVRVHLSCCLDKGSKTNIGHWVCASCSTCHEDTNKSRYQTSRKRKTKMPLRFRCEDDDIEEELNKSLKKAPNRLTSLRCRLCPHTGGAMSPSPGGGFCHEVCRIWAGCRTDISRSKKLSEVARNPLLNRLRTLCALCGGRVNDFNRNGEEELAKCAAAGCQVYFHPMCGLLASKIEYFKSRGEMSMNKPRNADEQDEQDLQFSKEYTLTMIKCRTKSTIEKSVICPVVFCGLHNPKRHISLFGCYPCGGLIGTAMRVPSWPEPVNKG